jgi:hypothetical protein
MAAYRKKLPILEPIMSHCLADLFQVHIQTTEAYCVHLWRANKRWLSVKLCQGKGIQFASKKKNACTTL